MNCRNPADEELGVGEDGESWFVIKQMLFGGPCAVRTPAR